MRNMIGAIALYLLSSGTNLYLPSYFVIIFLIYYLQSLDFIAIIVLISLTEDPMQR